MAQINQIKNNIEFLQFRIEELKNSSLSEQGNFSISLQIKNIESEIKNLQNILYQENLNRNKEVIALRLIGSIAMNGTFPLNAVGGITDTFSNALFKTSQFIQYGKKGGKKIEQILKNSLDIRLEALGSGSTIFYISAKTSPDIFGNSIIQNSLENTFDLLFSENDEQLLNNVEKVGFNSSKYFSKFLGELVKDNLELEITWESPDYETKKWYGNKDKISMFYHTFNNLETALPETIEFEGEIITLSIKNKIEVKDIQTNHSFSIKYPSSLFSVIKEFHIGETVNISISKITIKNTLTKSEKIEYNLIEIIKA